VTGADWKTEQAESDGPRLLRLADATVEVVTGPDAGRMLEIGPSRRVVGTSPEADLQLSDPRVSRRHLVLQAESDGVRLVDVGSRNGTRIGAISVRDVRIEQDTLVSLGSTQLAVRLLGKPLAVRLSSRTSFGEAVGRSPAMRHLFALLEPAARTQATILLEGDSGTGKDALARSIHEESARSAGPFVEVDCAAIPDNLVESELFGHERGAFTGALASRTGAFERAHGGTVFLDEVGELPMDAQPKLLRVLESRAFQRVGGSGKVQVDVRVVAATNRRLDAAVRAGRFREDLFYRLSVIHVRVPPLAQRPDDVAPLAEKFLRLALGDPDARVPAELLRVLRAYPWPGNARELRNVIERFATFGSVDPGLLLGLGRLGPHQAGVEAGAGAIDLGQLAEQVPYRDGVRVLLRRFEEVAFEAALSRTGGSIARAAELLGVPRATAYRAIARLRKRRPDRSSSSQARQIAR
jgi:DNA-binding NtrC family response regulator